MQIKLDLNADLGEGFGRYRVGLDHEMMDIVTSANIACGMHAGDPVIMKESVCQAVKTGTAIGAHLGYPDLWGFGRRHVELEDEELYSFLLYQLGSLAAFVSTSGSKLQHVKPHGALYNEAHDDGSLSRVISRVVCDFDPTLILMAPMGSKTARVGREMGLVVAEEAFADRAYCADGSLVPRGEAGAVLEDPEEASEQALSLALAGEVQTPGGKRINLSPDTICLHGDSKSAVRMAAEVREVLLDNGVHLVRVREVLEGRSR